MKHEAKTMTHEEYRARHIELHKALDELLADWITHNIHTGIDGGPYKGLGNTTLLELMEWSHAQTINPTEKA